MRLGNKTRGIASALVLAAALTPAMPAAADTNIKLSSWLQEISFKGDLRLREEYFDRTDGVVDRSRQRFRLRLNTDFKISDQFTIKTVFASGTGEQVSTNQTFDNLSQQKSLWIDRAYAVYSPLDWLTVQGGRMENPIWRLYSSDAIWDNDFNPEGFGEKLSQLFGPVNLTANFLQMVVDEDGGAQGGNNAHDQWMLGSQIGAEVRLPLETRLKVAFANYQWLNERQPVDAGVVQDGNRYSATTATSFTLANDYNVDELTAELGAWMFGKPLSFQGTMLRNVAASNVYQSKDNKGYQVGVIYGQAKEKNTWELGYFNKYLEADATVASVADSDFGNGGTNRKGNIGWIAYAPADYLTISLKQFFDVVAIDSAIAPSRNFAGGRSNDSVNRTQVDFVYKF